MSSEADKDMKVKITRLSVPGVPEYALDVLTVVALKDMVLCVGRGSVISELKPGENPAEVGYAFTGETPRSLRTTWCYTPEGRDLHVCLI